MIMGAWAQLIWVFFPIPIFCLALLSLTWPQKLERVGADVVGKIFFTKAHAGPVTLQLLWLFFAASALVFANAVRALQGGAGECNTCQYHGEILWYRKAIKFRHERNFWLSLFNVILWYMVWTVHRLRKRILALKDRVSDLEAVVRDLDGGSPKDGTGAPPKESDVPPKDEVSKKKD